MSEEPLPQSEIILYQTEDGRTRVQCRFEDETVWLGDPKRIALVAADLVAHFEKRVEAMDGKAMVVCMSRRIAVDLYDALRLLRFLGESGREIE